LLALDNLMVTPHLAAHRRDNFEPTVRQMFANISASPGEDLPAKDAVV
jgi:phosphoglycerate dehydrogenase-like enzyme